MNVVVLFQMIIIKHSIAYRWNELRPHLASNVTHSVLAKEEMLVLDLFSPPSATTGIERH